MSNLNHKKLLLCVIGMLVCLAILIGVFVATDDMTGDKNFSEYTREDWSVAILPLCVMILALIGVVVFLLMLIIPFMREYPAISDYVANKKMANIDLGTEFLVFDHNEFKRACCRHVDQNALWITVKEYDLKTKTWTVLEAGRHVEKGSLAIVLQQDYKYDAVKFLYLQHYPVR